MTDAKTAKKDMVQVDAAELKALRAAAASKKERTARPTDRDFFDAAIAEQTRLVGKLFGRNGSFQDAVDLRNAAQKVYNGARRLHEGKAQAGTKTLKGKPVNPAKKGS